jgi:hypothetical protein
MPQRKGKLFHNAVEPSKPAPQLVIKRQIQAFIQKFQYNTYIACYRITANIISNLE